MIYYFNNRDPVKQIENLLNEFTLNIEQVRDGIRNIDEIGKVHQANLGAREIEASRQKESGVPSKSRF
ncbi:MAG: hypothetical protein LBI70_00630 [Rickettsiales bacterium]|jgi:hypothetical protein|nr:hypothetical protein [Rickettsiales bacterium]